MFPATDRPLKPEPRSEAWKARGLGPWCGLPPGPHGPRRGHQGRSRSLTWLLGSRGHDGRSGVQGSPEQRPEPALRAATVQFPLCVFRSPRSRHMTRRRARPPGNCSSGGKKPVSSGYMAAHSLLGTVVQIRRSTGLFAGKEPSQSGEISAHSLLGIVVQNPSSLGLFSRIQPSYQD